MDPSALDLRSCTLSSIEQASFRYAVAAALSDHAPLLRAVRVEAGRLDERGGTEAADCAIEVTLSSGEVLSVWACQADVFDALEVGLRSLTQELRSAELRVSARAPDLARVA